MRWQCRYAPSLGGLEDTPDNVWKTKPYLDEFQPTVFMGLYGLNDFYALWRHQGRKAILWCGSDIRHFINGYWLDNKGSIRLLDTTPFAEWIDKNCESYVENGVEHEALMSVGINSRIVPSFLSKVDDYKVEYKWSERPQIYASVSGDNFAMYGWEQIEMIADQCHVDFHLYGNVLPWESKHSNVFVHGRVPKEQMNEEIKNMQCGLRVLEFDGFSEVLAKSILWGQYPISYIGYPHIDTFATNAELIEQLNLLVTKREPNLKAREYYMKNLNNYPWNHA
jgi:hypothetical protein